jgi:hypothetical protein
VPEGNTEEEIRRDMLFSYFSFYFDLRRLKNILSRPAQGVSWFNAGEGLWEVCKKLPALTFLSLMLFIKFGQLFHFMTMKKTALSFKRFVGMFDGLRPRGEPPPAVHG